MLICNLIFVLRNLIGFLIDIWDLLSFLNVNKRVILVVEIIYFSFAVISLDEFLRSCNIISSISFNIRVLIMDDILNNVKNHVFFFILSFYLALVLLFIFKFLSSCYRPLMLNFLNPSVSFFFRDDPRISPAIHNIYNTI